MARRGSESGDSTPDPPRAAQPRLLILAVEPPPHVPKTSTPIAATPLATQTVSRTRAHAGQQMEKGQAPA